MATLKEIELQESINNLVSKKDDEGRTVALIISEFYKLTKDAQAVGNEDRQLILSELAGQLIEDLPTLLDAFTTLAIHTKALTYYADIHSIIVDDEETAYKARHLVGSAYHLIESAGLATKNERTLQYLTIYDHLKDVG